LFDKIIINLENYYEINENLINDFDKKKKNYYLFKNINELEKTNNFIINDMNNIIKDDGFSEFINNSINIMNKMDIKYKGKNILAMSGNIGNKSNDKIIIENYFPDINENENLSNIKKLYENLIKNDTIHSPNIYDKLIFVSMLAEQCNLYEDMNYFLMAFIKNNEKCLSANERNLFSIACKNYIITIRSAIRTISAYENKEKKKRKKKEKFFLFTIYNRI